MSTTDSNSPDLAWRVALSERFILGTAHAVLADPEDAGRAMLDVLDLVGDTCRENGAADDIDEVFLGVLFGLATVAYKTAEPGTFGDGDAPMGLVMEDTHTGEALADPDAEIADSADGDPGKAAEGAGTLAAMRFFTAVANDEHSTATDLFMTLPDGASGHFLRTLLGYCGSLVVSWMYRAGHLDVADRARYEARAAAQADELPEPSRRVVGDREFVTLPVDPRDSSPDDRGRWAHDGSAQYGMSIYRLGTEGHRDRVIREALAVMGDSARLDAATLCGVVHARDVEVHEMPHSARTHARRALRDAARRHGGHWQAVQVWQHYGTCPDHSRDPGDGDVPLFDLPGASS